jgi:hypothetical protein
MEHIFVDIRGCFRTKPNLLLLLLLLLLILLIFLLVPWHFSPFSGPGLLDLVPPTFSLPCCGLPGPIWSKCVVSLQTVSSHYFLEIQESTIPCGLSIVISTLIPLTTEQRTFGKQVR